MKLEPVAWMNASKNITTDRAKKSMMEQRHYGVEFAIAADTAERFDAPLYAIPSGYVLVPVEPTEAMIDAAEKLDWGNEDVRGNCINQWQAMLTAAGKQ